MTEALQALIADWDRVGCAKAKEAEDAWVVGYRRGKKIAAQELRAALATPAPAQPDPLHVANERGEGWQPIESVPKSREPVLLFTQSRNLRIETGWYVTNLLAESTEQGFPCNFTHWMTLPAAPKEKP